jgi:GntR family transcriptional regulator
MNDFFKHFEQLDRTVPVPLYYQLKQQLVNLIKTKVLCDNDLIPPEVEFCKYFGISRPTVRQAMSELVMENYFVRKKGIGTFVAKPRVEGEIFQRIESFNQEMTRKGISHSTKVLAIDIVSDNPEVNSILAIEHNKSLVCLQRLRYTDEEPLLFQKTYFSFDTFSRVLKEDFEKKSLFAMLEKYYNVQIGHAIRKLKAINANSEIAKNSKLKVVKHFAMLKQWCFQLTISQYFIRFCIIVEIAIILLLICLDNDKLVCAF